MTTEKILEWLLREKEIYPPSVLDPHYTDTPEMARAEIIEKTMREMDRLLPLAEDPQSGEEGRDLSIVIRELQQRLPPDGKTKTCAAFHHLNAGCCNSCHTYRPHNSMSLIDLPDGGKGWVCCAVEWAIYPDRYVESMKRYAESM